MINCNINVDKELRGDGNTMFCATIKTDHAEVKLWNFDEDDAFAAALRCIQMDWTRRDYGKLFPSEEE